jgi:hypothetical protein
MGKERSMGRACEAFVVPKFQVTEAEIYQCSQIVRFLRAEHCEAFKRTRTDVYRELRATFVQSSFRRAWLVDGKLAALFGVTGMMLSSHGYCWLLLSEAARRYPIAIVKKARRQLAEIMITKRELTAIVIAGDEAAQRLAIFLGFHVSHDSGQCSPAFSRGARREFTRFLCTESKFRIPLGDGYVVALGYRHHLRKEA